MYDQAEVEKKVKEHYEKGQGSIQDIARVYRISVEDVLRIIGQEDLTTVTTQGDLIDPSEAGPGANMNYGEQHRVPYSND